MMRAPPPESAVRRSRRRRRRTIVALLVTVAVVTSTLGVVAVVQARRAEQQAQVARARELTSAAVAALDTDPELAGLLALAAADTAEPTADTISVLRRATSANRLSARHAWPDSIDHMVGIALSPDGTLAAYAGPLVRDPDIDRLEVRDVATWSVLWSIETRSYGVDGIWFSPDSTKLVTGLSTWTDEDVPRGVRVYRTRSGEIEATHGLGRCGATVSDVTSTTAIVQVWPPVDGSCTWEGAEVDPLSSLELVDLVDGEVTLIEPEILDAAPKLDDAGRLATFAVDEGGPRIVVIELATGRRILEIGPDEFGLDGGPPRELSPRRLDARCGPRTLGGHRRRFGTSGVGIRRTRGPTPFRHVDSRWFVGLVGRRGRQRLRVGSVRRLGHHRSASAGRLGRSQGFPGRRDRSGR